MEELFTSGRLPEPLWQELNGKLWHATDRVGLIGIISDGHITPGHGDRYTGSFARKIGAISLFDFGPAATRIVEAFGDWHGWFGHQQQARYAVWLEIDRPRAGNHLVDAAAARVEWNNGGFGLFIGGVEALYRGRLAFDLVTTVVLIARDRLGFFQRIGGDLSDVARELDRFEAQLPPEVEDPLVEAMRAGRQQAAMRAKGYTPMG